MRSHSESKNELEGTRTMRKTLSRVPTKRTSDKTFVLGEAVRLRLALKPSVLVKVVTQTKSKESFMLEDV